MSIARLANRPLTLRRQGSSGVDEYGNPEPTQTTIEIRGDVQLRSRTDDRSVDGRAVSVWMLMTGPEVDVRRDDVIEVDGKSFLIDGEVWPAWNPRLRRVTHQEANLKLVR